MAGSTTDNTPGAGARGEAAQGSIPLGEDGGGGRVVFGAQLAGERGAGVVYQLLCDLVGAVSQESGSARGAVSPAKSWT